jgi:TonB family protein
MKKLILTSATLLFALAAFTQKGDYTRKWYRSEFTPDPGSRQELMFEVHGIYSRPVKKVNLNEVRLISDISPGYPVNWVEYVSTEILATCNGKTMKATGVNNMLTPEQKNILKLADLGTDIVVNVKYKSRNAATDNIEIREINISVNVIPDTEAEYVGGYPLMVKYLQENIINKISETVPEQYQQGAVKFTINEEGEIINAKISKTSGDAKTDKLFIEAINKMPRWKPAQNSKGLKLKQEFEFSVGGGGC